MKLVDPSVHTLAEDWLSDDASATHVHEARVQSLAEAIQRAIEDWQQDEAEASEAAADAHRTDEGDLGHLAILGGR